MSTVEDINSVFMWSTSADQLPKPLRVSWFAEGHWWAILRGGDRNVHRRETNGTWTDTGLTLSTDNGDRFDAFLHTDGSVYVASTSGVQPLLRRLTYNAGTNDYSVDATQNLSFALGTSGNPSCVVDTNGTVFIANDEELAVHNASTLAEIDYTATFFTGAATQSVSAVKFSDTGGAKIAFTSEVGSTDGTLYIHADGDPAGTWSTEVFGGDVDNHIFAVGKGQELIVCWKHSTETLASPIISVRKRLANGTWESPVEVFTCVSTQPDENHTRPRIVYDASADEVWVAAPRRTGDVDYFGGIPIDAKVADWSTLTFSPDFVLFESGTDDFADVNVTSQHVDNTTNLLWLARNRPDPTLGDFSVWESHIDLPFTAPDPLPPEEGVVFFATASGSGSDTATVTTETIASGTNVLYLCLVSARTGSVIIDTVSGGGLTWAPVISSICHARGQMESALWYAHGSPASDFAITVSSVSTATTMVANAVAYTGAKSDIPVEFAKSNTNGIDGACSGGVDNNTPTITFSPSTANSVIAWTVSRAAEISTTDPDYISRGYAIGGAGGNAVQIYAHERDGVPDSPETITHTLSGDIDWAMAAVAVEADQSETTYVLRSLGGGVVRSGTGILRYG